MKMTEKMCYTNTDGLQSSDTKHCIPSKLNTK